MIKLDNYCKPPERPFTGTELYTVRELWLTCRWIELRLLRPQGKQKPISFKDYLGGGKL